MFKIKGVVKLVKPTEVISDKFQKRELILTDAASMYPQDISFQLAQDKCSLADNIVAGNQIEVSFNIRGREWTSPAGEVKYFNTLDCWRIDMLGATTAPPMAHQKGIDPITANTRVEGDDDLLF